MRRRSRSEAPPQTPCSMRCIERVLEALRAARRSPRTRAAPTRRPVRRTGRTRSGSRPATRVEHPRVLVGSLVHGHLHRLTEPIEFVWFALSIDVSRLLSSYVRVPTYDDAPVDHRILSANLSGTHVQRKRLRIAWTRRCACLMRIAAIRGRDVQSALGKSVRTVAPRVTCTAVRRPRSTPWRSSPKSSKRSRRRGT